MKVGITQKSSPLRFCFLIKPNSTKNFERALQIAYSLWGGLYSPILPLYKRIPKSVIQEYDISVKTTLYYKNVINNYDPDVILYDKSLDAEYINAFSEGRRTIEIEDFEGSLIKEENEYGINFLQILKSILASEFKYQRNDDLKLFFPNTKKSNLFLKTFLGTLPENMHKWLNKNLNETKFHVNSSIDYSNLSTFLPNRDFSYLDINLYGIRTRPERHWYKGQAIYFFDDKRLNDLINYWNLRALGWSVIPVPIKQIDNEYFEGFITRFISHYIEKNNGIFFINYLLGFNVTNEDKKLVDEKLNSISIKLGGDIHFGYQGWFPRMWEKRSILESDKAICEQTIVEYKYSQVDIDENYVKCGVNKLPFDIQLNDQSHASYKVNLSFKYYEDQINHAGLIYGIDTQDWNKLSHSFGLNTWRLSNSGLSLYVNNIEDEINFYVPQSVDFFKIYFSKRGNVLKETANGQLANEVLKNIGGLRGTYLFRNKLSLTILELFENGKIVPYSQLIGEIKKNLRFKKNDEVDFFVKRLLDNKIIEFGSKIQCPICNQRTFYMLPNLDEKLVCSVCRNNHELPTHKPRLIEWAYRGIGPFSKNNKVGGLMSVFMTLRLFNKEFADSYGNMSSLIGFELIKKGCGLKEVDLAVLLQDKNEDIIPPDLFLCECKTYKNFTNTDIERMIESGEEFPNSILTFATLNDSLQKEEKKQILEVVSHFRTGVGNRPLNPVLILTASELIPDDLFNHFKSYKDEPTQHIRHNDWIGNLCELTVKKHLGIKTWGEIRSELWQKEMEERNKKNAPQHFV